MRILLRSVSVVLVLAMTTVVAMADAPTKFSPGFFGAALLKQESVKKELKLSDDQAKKLQELADSMEKRFRESTNLSEQERTKKFQEWTQESDKAIEGILKPDQAKRLQEIVYQQLGERGAALTNDDVAQALQLTDEQKKKIKDMRDESTNQIRALLKPNTPPDDATRKKIGEIQKAAGEKMTNVLTEQQKTKWKAMQGDPFKGEIKF